jgi:transposase
MEAMSDYWKPAFYSLEAAGFETWLVNARVSAVTEADKLDAVWLCKVAERQMLRRLRPRRIPYAAGPDPLPG